MFKNKRISEFRAGGTENHAHQLKELLAEQKGFGGKPKAGVL